MRRCLPGRDAITFRLREDREDPFERVLELGLNILEGKARRREGA